LDLARDVGEVPRYGDVKLADELPEAEPVDASRLFIGGLQMISPAHVEGGTGEG
jgi:hypothetical protein